MMRRTRLLVGVVVLVAVLGSAAWLRFHRTMTLTGTFTLLGPLTAAGSPIGGELGECHGTGGYRDIQPGMVVSVRDGGGNIIATGRTTAYGKDLPVDVMALAIALPRPDLSGARNELEIARWILSPRVCQMPFVISGVPRVGFYEIEVGTRGRVTYSLAEMDRRGWKVELTIGP